MTWVLLMITIILVISGHCYCGDHFVDDNHFSDQGKEGGGEVDLPLGVHRHVHPDQLLVRQPVRALTAEAEGRVHVLQHVVHLGVVDPPRGAGGEWAILSKLLKL